MFGQVTIQHVAFSDFVVVTIAVITLIAAVSAIAFSKVSSVSERVAVTEKQNEGDENNFKVLFSKIDYLERERVNDKILYNEAINKLNLTLGKIEGALENNNILVRELREEWNKRQ